MSWGKEFDTQKKWGVVFGWPTEMAKEGALMFALTIRVMGLKLGKAYSISRADGADTVWILFDEPEEKVLEFYNMISDDGKAVAETKIKMIHMSEEDIEDEKRKML